MKLFEVPKIVHNRYERHITLFGDDHTHLAPLKIELPRFSGPPLNAHNSRRGKWQRAVMPKQLEELISECGGDRNKIYNILWSKKSQYKVSHDFINEDWRRRKYGVDIYIGGEKVYLTGLHYFYLQWWPLDIGYAEYRDRDRLFYYVWDWICRDPNSVGMLWIKHRRDGASYKGECICYEYTSRRINACAGVISKSESDAMVLFSDKMVSPWKRVPFWHRPIFEGTTNLKGGVMSFIPPGKHITRAKAAKDTSISLGGWIRVGPTTTAAFDGTKLHRGHFDELAKIENCDPYDLWNKHRPCFTTGSNGKALLTTTTTKVTAKTWASFEALVTASKGPWHERTASGLRVVYIPAYVGLDEGDHLKFINEYGHSDTSGALAHLRESLQKFIDIDDKEGLVERMRQYPIDMRDAMIGDTGSGTLNKKNIINRISVLSSSIEDPFVMGDLMWESKQFGPVKFVPHREGKWCVSWQAERPNGFLSRGGRRYPVNEQVIVAADPFRYGKTKSSKRSKGGIVVYHQDHQIVGDYLYRTDTQDMFSEEVAKAAIYWSGRATPETNIDAVLKYFDYNGLAGYLVHDLDESGRWSKNPGVYMSNKVKEDIFVRLGDWVTNFSLECNHMRLLDQLMGVTYDTMTHYDLVAAAGIALRVGQRLWALDEWAGSIEVAEDKGYEMPFTVYRY